MEPDSMYVVVNGEAIMLEHGTASTYLVDVDGTIDWDSHDTLDWEDMLPEAVSYTHLTLPTIYSV